EKAPADKGTGASNPSIRDVCSDCITKAYHGGNHSFKGRVVQVCSPKENIHMNKRLIQFVFAVLLHTACTGKADSSADPARRPTETPIIPSFLLPVERVIVRSASYTIIARDPTQALLNLQRAVEKAG